MADGVRGCLAQYGTIGQLDWEDVRGMVCVNVEEAASSLYLAPHGRIELGETQFVFIPFAGGNFN
jgi:hypothetical protein